MLLPAAHATTLAGTTTMIGTSSNLLIAGIAHGAGVDIDMLSFAPVAVPVALVGWLIIYLIAPRMLRGRTSVEAPAREWRVEIPVAASALARNRRAASMGIGATQDYELTGIERWGELLAPDTPIAEDDVLVFAASEDGVGALWRSPLFGLPPQRLFGVTVKAGESGTLYDFEHDGSIRVVAARTDRPFRDTELIPGRHVLRGRRQRGRGRRAATASGCGRSRAAARRSRARRGSRWGSWWPWWWRRRSASLRWSWSRPPGRVLMVLTGVLRPRPAARALDLRLLFILAGSIGLGTIVVESGLADALAEGIREASGGNVALVIVVLALTTAAMTNLVTNAATASILTPVGIGLASELGIDPVTILALIGTCVSFTLINPFSHQSNMMVMRPGGYTTATFARFGAPAAGRRPGHGLRRRLRAGGDLRSRASRAPRRALHGGFRAAGRRSRAEDLHARSRSSRTRRVDHPLRMTASRRRFTTLTSEPRPTSVASSTRPSAGARSSRDPRCGRDVGPTKKGRR